MSNSAGDAWEQFSRVDLESQVSPEIMTRGLAYYHDGHLLQAARIGMARAGVLAGTSGNYQARLWFEGGLLRFECTCPFQGFCKHLVAVAIGWLAEPDFFVNLQPEMERILADRRLLQNTFTSLCHQEPFALWRFIKQSSPSNEFHSARGILNLVRNIFSSPQQPLDQGAAIWEKVKRIEELLIAEMRRGSSEAIPPFVELLKGLAAVYLDFPETRITDSFREIIIVLGEFPPGLSEVQLKPVVDILLALYFEPKLWDWQETCRDGFVILTRRFPQFLLTRLNQKKPDELPTLGLISFYELLMKLVPVSGGLTGGVVQSLAAAEQCLQERPDGLLWLVDRWMEDNTTLAFHLAQEGMRRTDRDLRRALRERLVRLHTYRGEVKQAAALSFALFREDPSLAEYLRLKSILQEYPLEKQNYLQQANRYLEGQCGSPNRNCERLKIQIAIEEQNHQVIGEYIKGPAAMPEMLQEIARFCLTNHSPAQHPFYPPLIRAFLADHSPQSWQTARYVLADYKKICLQESRSGEWNEFCRELQQLYQADRSFSKKFGALLAEMNME